MTEYNAAFYADQQDESLRSAMIILPLLFERFRPSSVVDVGCGLGTWLAICRDLGIHDVLGLDGDYVTRQKIKIPPECFCPIDISESFHLTRVFDLAIAVEVAEHLPVERADSFVADLVSLSNIVLFSAAIPYQGGTGHVNENWPEYWASLFRTYGYRVVDFLRPLIWGDNRVGFWYRQNLLLFVKESSYIASYFSDINTGWPLSIVHPEMFLYACHRFTDKLNMRTNFEQDRHYYSINLINWTQGKVPLAKDQLGYGKEFPTRFTHLNLVYRSICKVLRQLCHRMKNL